MKYNPLVRAEHSILLRGNHDMIRYDYLILPVVLIPETGRLGEGN
jgi:hypothetical protein